MSDLPQVYENLAAKAVVLAGKTVRTYGLGELANSVDTVQLPCRLLLPLGTPTEGRNFGFIALGRTFQVTWQVVDLFLYKSVTQGLGLPEAAPALIAYAAAYTDMLQTFRAPTSRTYIENTTITPGLYEWPRDSGRIYTGVEVLLEIVEVKGG